MLDANFAKPGISLESGPGELNSVVLEHAGACVRLCTYGAHVLSYIPRGQRDALWLSPQADFSPGKSIRGGLERSVPSRARSSSFARASRFGVTGISA